MFSALFMLFPKNKYNIGHIVGSHYIFVEDMEERKKGRKEGRKGERNGGKK